MIGGAAKSLRKIHIIGTKGEISGNYEENKFVISRIAVEEEDGFIDETVDLDVSHSQGHGGGDEALTRDFIDFIKTGNQSISCTSIYNSVAGHLTVFLADKSMENGGAPQKCDFSQY